MEVGVARLVLEGAGISGAISKPPSWGGSTSTDQHRLATSILLAQVELDLLQLLELTPGQGDLKGPPEAKEISHKKQRSLYWCNLITAQGYTLHWIAR